ncbi:MAG TPA: DHA2 family efflux MFS transporter permease subunit [Candidatus Cybelea sp.]|nr:DHA2 family efflux MFS transporter permease subunit [Candidatus Cybelea sp.]
MSGEASVDAVRPLQPPQAGEPPPVGWRELVGFFAMVFGMFMAILDIQIVTSSLSELQAGLSASTDEISWVQTSYLIAEIIMIPLSGWLSRVLSTRWLFLASVIGFTVMSAACAFADDLNTMIVLRAAQGFLGGAMIPTVFATSYTIFSPKRRASNSVLMGLVATSAPTLGPTLGGWITADFTWHWLFLVNVVPGTIVTLLVFLLVDFDRPHLHLLRRFDWLGVILVALFLGSLEYVLEEGPRNEWFDTNSIVIFTIVAAVAGVVFFWWELTTKNPVVVLRTFKNKNFAIGCLFSFVIGIGLYGAVYITPLFLGQVARYDSMQIGMLMSITGIFQMMVAPIAGKLTRTFDLRYVLSFGLLLLGASIALNSVLTHETRFWELFLPQAMRGMALMCCFVPINALTLGTLTPEQVRNGAGFYNLTRNLGGAIGLASINTVLTDRYALHHTRLMEAITARRLNVQAVLDSLAARFSDMMPGNADLAALKTIGNLVQREALVLTYSDCLFLMSFVFFAALLMMPMVNKVVLAINRPQT